jgi:tRNA pseudouridine13 synthase
VLTFFPSPERFTVEEIAAYEPSGEGEHLFLWIEKRGLTTPEAVTRVAAALGVAARDVGYAGLKDRHAVTRQWLSAPGASDERIAHAMDLRAPDLTVLSASRHRNKLRVGHLKGNRFELVLTGTASDDDMAALHARWTALLAAGVPNVFGKQRFGARGDNAAAGLAILRGERRERDRRKRLLLTSALQSAVFNEYLALRATSGALTQVILGDVLKKTDTGGLFVVVDEAAVAEAQPRVDNGAVVPTGPLPGTREVEPPEGTPARALEDRAIAACGATRADFERSGRDLPGARRPVLLAVQADGPGWAEELGSTASARALRLSFSLPAGAYATVIADALTGPAQ